jgi:hypothetical protein
MSVVYFSVFEISFVCEMFLHFPVSVPVWNSAHSLCLATVYTEVPPQAGQRCVSLVISVKGEGMNCM